MFKYNDIKDTNVIFTNLFISYVIITTLLNNFVIKPFFIDKIQPNEDVSQLLKTYFFNNYNESFIIELFFTVIKIFTTIKIFNLLNIQPKYCLFAIIGINMISTLFYDFLLKNIILTGNNDKEIILFFKKYLSFTKFVFLWNQINSNFIMLFMLFLLKFKLNLFYTIISISFLFIFKLIS